MAQSLTTSRDIPLIITSPASSSERRITPSWTIAHLKTKLEPVTGIPPSSQKLTLRLPEPQQEIALDAQDEETTQIGSWPLVAYAEIHVCFIVILVNNTSWPCMNTHLTRSHVCLAEFFPLYVAIYESFLLCHSHFQVSERNCFGTISQCSVPCSFNIGYFVLYYPTLNLRSVI